MSKLACDILNVTHCPKSEFAGSGASACSISSVFFTVVKTFDSFFKLCLSDVVIVPPYGCMRYGGFVPSAGVKSGNEEVYQKRRDVRLSALRQRAEIPY